MEVQMKGIVLGIGANSAPFSVARAFLWQSSRVAQPEELVRMFVRWSSGLNYGSFSYLDYLDVRDRNDVFAGVIANTIMPFHVSAGDRNERIWGAAVSGNYFSVMGLKMS